MTKFRRILPFIASFFLLIAILLAITGYQYWRVKNELAATVIKAVNTAELGKLQLFLGNVEKRLLMVREWGKQGLLDMSNHEELNKQLLPLLQHEPDFSGLILADAQGAEYFLTRVEEGYLLRETIQGKNGAEQHFHLVNESGMVGQGWQQKATYNPTNRPWFKTSENIDDISWTKPYTFMQSQEEGVTASLGWEHPDDRPGYTVFGIDILLSRLKQQLSTANLPPQAEFFLINSRGDTFGTGHIRAPGMEQDGMDAVLSEIKNSWEEEGRPSLTLTVARHNGQKWLASMQPLLHEGRSLWVGVVMPEKNLLQMFNKRLYSIDFAEVAAILIVSPILLIYLWKSGAWRNLHASAPTPAERLYRLLEEGEGAGVEFKSSVRMNRRAGSHGKEIELAWLKAVVAFLNSSGGVVLLGVDDEGNIVGLEADGFENDDRCLLHLKNLIHQHIGAEFSGLIDITLVADETGHQVAMVECRTASAPVFLLIGKNEEFYIRSGPSSTKLSPSQMVKHIMRTNS